MILWFAAGLKHPASARSSRSGEATGAVRGALQRNQEPINDYPVFVARHGRTSSYQAWCVDLFKLKTIPGSNAYGRGSESLMMSSFRALVSHLKDIHVLRH